MFRQTYTSAASVADAHNLDDRNERISLRTQGDDERILFKRLTLEDRKRIFGNMPEDKRIALINHYYPVRY